MAHGWRSQVCVVTPLGAAWLREQMARHELTVPVVARRAGVPTTTVRRALAGKTLPWGIELKLSVAVARREVKVA
jgi:hypothetical protein